MKISATGSISDHHRTGGGGSNKNFGVFIGKIKDNIDESGLGRLRVWIPQLSAANENDESRWFTVRYCPPFAGAENSGDESKANNSTTRKQTNQSYGMWMVPPHKNVNVVCAFLNGETGQGIWWACLPHDGHTHSLPGLASGQTHDGQISPVAERNRYNTTDAQFENRPEHPLNNTLKGQGLEKDLRRGQNNAGPFRAKDKHPGYAYGFVSPGQHQFLIDDGADGNSGQIKIRVKSGASITIDGTDGFINIINSSGSAWIEVDADGNIDVFSEKDFSVGAVGNINFRAGNNVNIEAGNNINLLANTNIIAEACEIVNITGTIGVNFTSGLNMNILADSQMKLTGQRIDLNGPAAQRAEIPAVNNLITNRDVGKSIASRVPEKEPYGGHSQRFGEQISIPTGQSNIESTIEPAVESYKDTPLPTQTNAVDCIPEVSEIAMSAEGFALMLGREAYRGMMYSDFLGYSVGYGTRVDIFGPTNPASKLDQNIKTALLAGPSEEEARLAARQVTDRHVTPYIASALKKALVSAGKQVCITQAQVDALIMACFGNPSEAISMAGKVVQSGANSADGKPTNADIATIWANSRYSNSADVKNSEANFAMTGKSNPGMKNQSQYQLKERGVAADFAAVKNNKAASPSESWSTELGGGPSGGKSVKAAYGKPSVRQLAQFERSYYLNTGKAAPSTTLTAEQLRDKYGEVQLARIGNSPPNSPSKV